MKNLILIFGVICGSMAAVMIFVGMLMVSWWSVDFSRVKPSNLTN